MAPWAVHITYSYIANGETDRDIGGVLIFPFILLRILHNQLWISLSRHQTAKKRIIDKAIEFDQVDRESNWYLSTYIYIRARVQHGCSRKLVFYVVIDILAV